jgi:poly-gamma-glutamate synthesis protein (capsule biosynthesis protein)
MGTGATLDQAWQPAIIEKNGIKIGFVGASYASINDGGKASNIYVARMEDTDRLKKTVGNLKSLVDFIVVTMHGGTEYTATANAGQITFAHAAIDSGADIVIGAHPHWVQNKETYKDKPIYYSLGNFIFDQSWSEQTKKGLVLKITLSKLGKTSINRTSAPANAASISDLQPTGNPSTPTSSATIDSIEEIPIHIEENCCPSLIEKEPKK